jgi:hypothetical protein
MMICVEPGGERYLFKALHGTDAKTWAHTFLIRGFTAYHAVYVPGLDLYESKHCFRYVLLPPTPAPDYKGVIYVVKTCDGQSSLGTTQLLNKLAEIQDCTDRDMHVLHTHLAEFCEHYHLEP